MKQNKLMIKPESIASQPSSNGLVEIRGQRNNEAGVFYYIRLQTDRDDEKLPTRLYYYRGGWPKSKLTKPGSTAYAIAEELLAAAKEQKLVSRVGVQ